MSDLERYEVTVFAGHDGKGDPLGQPVRVFESALVSGDHKDGKWYPALDLKVGEIARLKKLDAMPSRKTP